MTEQPPQPGQYRCDEDDLGCLNDYFMAALEGQERKLVLLRLWKQQLEAIRHSLLSQQQEPAPDDEQVYFDVVPEPTRGMYRIYVNFYNAGTFSIELSKEQLESLGIQIWNVLPNDKHDAAIAAEAIRKERERIRDAVEKRMDTQYEAAYGYKGILAIIDGGK